jgi:hypothetical protein
MKKSNVIRIIKETINESQIKYYLETYVNNKQMLGSDGTLVLGDNMNKIDEKVKQQAKRVKSLIKIKPNIKKAKKITLKLVDNNDKTIKTFDITKDVLN